MAQAESSPLNVDSRAAVDRGSTTQAEPPLGRGRQKIAPAKIGPVSGLDQVQRSFRRVQGPQINAILVAPEAQSHVVVDNHPLKRHVALSQPSGNAGAGWWWSSKTVQAFDVLEDPRPVSRDGLSGVEVTLVADQPGSVRFEPPILDSVRAIRDRLATGEETRAGVREEGAKLGLVPADAIRPRVVGGNGEDRVVLERSSIAGTHRHRLEIRGLDGTTLERDVSGEIEIRGDGKKRPSIAVAYLTDLPALTPFAPTAFLNERAAERLAHDLSRLERGRLSRDEAAEIRLVHRALEDLSAMVFKEKAIAGGWRFLTYFGRDTLQTMMMLRPLLSPPIVESILQAALDRISSKGQVAHEEDLADQAEHVRLTRAMKGEQGPDRTKWSEPIYDYKMVDDDFMLGSAIAEYLNDASIGEDRKRAFLEHPNAAGGTNLAAIGRNASYIADRAAGYAESVRVGRPDATQLIEEADPRALIALQEGSLVGDWRDSDAGLGFGRYPASINLELVPTTLEKTSAMVKSLAGLGYDTSSWAPGLAGRFDHGSGASAETKLEEMAKRWAHARRHFDVVIPPEQLAPLMKRFLEKQSDAGREYFRAVDVGGATVGEIAGGTPLPAPLAKGWRFSAVSLDAETKPVPVMSSDGLFGLIGSSLRESSVAEMTRLATTPYPLGLATPAGLLISNPVLSGSEAIEDIMSPGRYHGTVVWTWLEALGLAALSHQRAEARAGGKGELVREIDRALTAIEAQVAGEGELQTLELHGWKIEESPQGSRIIGKPFEGAANETLEAWPGNATQLWATALPLVRWARHQRLMT